MRIAILADPIDNQKAGIHYYTKELLSHLGAINSTIEYIYISQKAHPEIKNIKQLTVKNYKIIPGYKAFRMFFKIPWILKKLKVDVVVEPAHFGPFNLPKKVKRVTVIHDLTPILFPKYHTFHSQILQRIFLKSILKRAKLIITNSKYTKDDVLKVYPFTEGKVNYIHLGKDAIFKPIKNSGKTTLNYGVSEPYFLFVGTIEPRKNLEVLLNAFEKIKQSGNENLSLVIIGQKGWKSKGIFKYIEEHKFKNDIILPGYIKRDDLAAFYSSALACIQPSLYEGFGMPVVESISCGTPCIVSNVSSLPEVGGDAVLLFKSKSVTDLESQMNKILTNSDLRKELKSKALKRSENFDWTSHAKEFNLLMKNLMLKK